MERHELPADGKQARMDEQSQIHDTGAVIQRRRVQDKRQAFASKKGEQVGQAAGPQGHDGDVFIRQEPCQAALDTGRGGWTNRQQFLGDQRQACLARENQAKAKEGERFGPMPVQVGEELAQLDRPRSV